MIIPWHSPWDYCPSTIVCSAPVPLTPSTLSHSFHLFGMSPTHAPLTPSFIQQGFPVPFSDSSLGSSGFPLLEAPQSSPNEFDVVLIWILFQIWPADLQLRLWYWLETSCWSWTLPFSLQLVLLPSLSIHSKSLDVGRSQPTHSLVESPAMTSGAVNQLSSLKRKKKSISVSLHKTTMRVNPRPLLSKVKVV